jgi:hypothetical protein
MIYITKDTNERLDYLFVREMLDPIVDVQYTTDAGANIVVEACNVNPVDITDTAGNVYPAGQAIVLWVSGGDVGKKEKIVLSYTTEGGRQLDEAVIFTVVQENN